MIHRRHVLLGAGALTLSACGGGNSQPPPPPAMPVQTSPIDLTQRPWHFMYGSAFPAFRNGLQFDIPSVGDIHYLECPLNINAQDMSSISFVVEIQSSPDIQFAASDKGETPPCHFSVMLECVGDNLSTDGYRWFSHKCVLTPGVQAVSIPLTVDNWTGIFGEQATATNGFGSTIKNLANVSLTFGGESFAGHGIYIVQGTASFNIKSAVLA